MRSPAPASDDLAVLERALERAVNRHSGVGPVWPMVRWHFGYDDPAGSRRGKRLRMRLVLEAAAEEGAAPEDALDAACAIELVHNYSLVHDDLEDGDRTRHHREAVWARYGPAHGINAGDALNAIAYLALLDPSRPAPGARTVAMTRALHAAALRMCDGQARDIGFETAVRATMEDYLAMIDGKTAALFGAACELGALAADAPPERAAAYARLGRAYGVAFQIEDDLLGAWGDPAATGKPSGADLARRKWTFPVVWALEGPPSPDRTVVAEAYARGAALDPETAAQVSEALLRLGARDAAEAAVRGELAAADALAAAHGLDAGGRVRAFFGRSVRRVA